MWHICYGNQEAPQVVLANYNSYKLALDKVDELNKRARHVWNTSGSPYYVLSVNDFDHIYKLRERQHD